MENNNSFYSINELNKMGFKVLGNNVQISRKASFYSPKSIEIGNSVRVDDFCILTGNINIGSYVHISAYSALYGNYGIEIGDFSGLSPRCTVFSASDDFSGNFLIGPTIDSKYTNVQGGRVIIMKFCQIGANTVIFPDVTIEEGVAVGAMSLINKNLKGWGIYAGIPAKRLKEREKSMIEFVSFL